MYFAETWLAGMESLVWLGSALIALVGFFIGTRG